MSHARIALLETAVTQLRADYDTLTARVADLERRLEVLILDRAAAELDAEGPLRGDTTTHTKPLPPFRQRVLDGLRAHGPVSPTDLAGHLGLTDDGAPVVVANTCAWLTRHGFALRAPRTGRRVFYQAARPEGSSP